MRNSTKEATQDKGFKTKGSLYDKASKKASHTLRKMQKAGRGNIGRSINASLEG